MKRWLISVSCAALIASAVSVAFALPTVGDVQAEVQKGNYTQAQTMMREVVEAKPGSAKAHYIYAEILAHNARFVDAAEQARVAKQLDPAVKFTDPQKFAAFQQLLDREQQRAQPKVSQPSNSDLTPLPRQSSPAVSPAVPSAMPTQAPVERSGGIPVWVWVGVAALAFIGWRMMRGRLQAPMAAQAAGPSFGSYGAPTPYGGGPTPGYGPGGGMMQPGGGSGMLGVGLAAAGGVAAGMLAEKYLDSRHAGNVNPQNQAFDSDMFDGGNSFASPEREQAAKELENRNVDFGSGNDWTDGGSSSSDGGSFDTGGSSGSDDW